MEELEGIVSSGRVREFINLGNYGLAMEAITYLDQDRQYVAIAILAVAKEAAAGPPEMQERECWL
jgi:hypothetical protein